MKKTGGVFNLYKLNLKPILNCDRVKLIYAVITVLGVLIGLFLFNSNSLSNEFSKFFFEKLLIYKKSADFLFQFSSSFFVFFLIIFIIISFGTSPFGIVILPLISLSINVIFGSILAYSYSSMDIKGIAFNSVLLIPTYILLSFGMINSLSSAQSFAYSLFSSLIGKSKSSQISLKFNEMLKKHISVLIIIFLASLFDIAISRVFVKMLL